MRIGYSYQSMLKSRTVVEHNLFERCDGEIEIISSKSCENVYRYNTFQNCEGTLTLRHGNRCTVEGNFFIGNHKRGSGGIRVIGEDHVIINNYIDGVDKGGFWITAGVPNSPLNGYYCARRATIAFNTVVDSRGPCLELDAGLAESYVLSGKIGEAKAATAKALDPSFKPKFADRPVPSDQVTNFDVLYKTHCAGCHGADGKLGPAPPVGFCSDNDWKNAGEKKCTCASETSRSPQGV